MPRVSRPWPDGLKALSRRQAFTCSAQMLVGAAALIASRAALTSSSTARASSNGRSFLPRGNGASNPPPIPSQYTALASELDTRIAGYQTYLSSLTPQPPMPHMYVAALYTANPASVPVLLNPDTMNQVTLELDTLRAIGVQGVDVMVAYPLLDPSFPNHTGYLNFFTRVAAEVKLRNMTLSIENGNLLSDPATYGGVSYNKLTLDGYFAARTAQAQLIAQYMTPTYLSLDNEPSTVQHLTGFQVTPARQTQFINQTLATVPRGQIQYSAGAGSWDDPSYFTSLMTNTTLNQGDIHLFPLASPTVDYFKQAAHMTDQARANGKGITITQCSLYKESALELAQHFSRDQVFLRDIYDFWQPLDTRFLYLMQQFCQVEGVKLFGYMMSINLHQAYLPYNSATMNYSYQQGTNAAVSALLDSLNAKTYSATGTVYGQIAKGG